MTLRSHHWEQRFLRLALLDRQEKAIAVAEEIQQIISPNSLTELFDEFIDSTKSAIHHHTDSYTHDNGFDKIVLFQDNETKMKMRLHIWHPSIIPNTKRARQNVHNHRWDFSSAVLTGHANNVSYRFAEDGEDGEEFYHYRYYARGSKEHYEVEQREKARLVCTENQRFVKGEIYSVNAELLHRVDTPNEILVATLIITHENVGWVTNDLLSESSIGFERTVLPSPAMTREEIVEKITDLRRHLLV
jgi:predicted metal-dependent enzyme (double-stranded beta helix superfamily)